jgi:3-ketoacyl-CoA synthase
MVLDFISQHNLLRRAQFKLLQSVRTQFISEESVGCVFEREDPAGHHGVALSKDIVKVQIPALLHYFHSCFAPLLQVAGRAMERNLTSLGPLVLPISEQLPVVWSLALKQLRVMLKALLCALGFAKLGSNLPKVAHRDTVYVPC